ncbi:branched-chain amino acid ABC transporter permease [Ruegeria arenilitoris]|uniref:branched-chain amino acid ABC transporter permease n=1 Tax=Ruegeria arenilitoris TaxID=1173585 RepID=UPI0020C292E6|nr:branched-chain amino acid ABC transporter permease [Ruegeria arenilitoris]
MTQYVILAVFAVSMAYIWGFGGILSFGHAAVFGLGGYAYAVLAINMDSSLLAFVLAIGACGLFALILGYFIFYGRLNDVYLGVVTLVVSLILWKLINHTSGPGYVIGNARLGGFNGIPSVPVLELPWHGGAPLDPIQMFRWFLGGLIAVYVALKLLIRSKFGRIAIAAKENELRATLLGYDVRKYKLMVFVIGGAVGGMAGAMWATYQTFVDPNMFSLEVSAKVLIWVMVGGVGTLLGPIAGVVLLQALSIKLGETAFINNQIVLGVILMGLVLVFPKGLLPSLEPLVSRLFDRASTRKQGANP